MAKNFSDELILLEELRNRNARAYRHLYQSSRNRLFALAFAILKDQEAAKDLIQEFFTDFWDHKLYDNISFSVKSYLYYAVRNRAFNYRKSEHRYALLIESLHNLEQPQTPRYFENEELKQMIETAIDKLTPMAAKTFRMHYLENLTHIEISKQLGIVKSTVGNHIHLALTQLRKDLKNKL